MKKRLITLILTIVFILVFSACSNGSSGGKNGFLPQSNGSTPSNQFGKTPSIPSVGNQSNASISGSIPDTSKPEYIPTDITLSMPDTGEIYIHSYLITKDAYGRDILVLKMDYTNESDSDNSPNYVIADLGVYQEDVRQILIFSEYDNDERNSTIRPGKTLEVIVTYELRNSTSDIYFELSDSQTVYGSVTLDI